MPADWGGVTWIGMDWEGVGWIAMSWGGMGWIGTDWGGTGLRRGNTGRVGSGGRRGSTMWTVWGRIVVVVVLFAVITVLGAGVVVGAVGVSVATNTVNGSFVGSFFLVFPSLFELTPFI